MVMMLLRVFWTASTMGVRREYCALLSVPAPPNAPRTSAATAARFSMFRIVVSSFRQPGHLLHRTGAGPWHGSLFVVPHRDPAPAIAWGRPIGFPSPPHDGFGISCDEPNTGKYGRICSKASTKIAAVRNLPKIVALPDAQGYVPRAERHRSPP